MEHKEKTPETLRFLGFYLVREVGVEPNNISPIMLVALSDAFLFCAIPV